MITRGNFFRAVIGKFILSIILSVNSFCSFSQSVAACYETNKKMPQLVKMFYEDRTDCFYFINIIYEKRKAIIQLAKHSGNFNQLWEKEIYRMDAKSKSAAFWYASHYSVINLKDKIIYLFIMDQNKDILLYKIDTEGTLLINGNPIASDFDGASISSVSNRDETALFPMSNYSYNPFTEALYYFRFNYADEKITKQQLSGNIEAGGLVSDLKMNNNVVCFTYSIFSSIPNSNSYPIIISLMCKIDSNGILKTRIVDTLNIDPLNPLEYNKQIEVNSNYSIMIQPKSTDSDNELPLSLRFKKVFFDNDVGIDKIVTWPEEVKDDIKKSTKEKRPFENFKFRSAVESGDGNIFLMAERTDDKFSSTVSHTHTYTPSRGAIGSPGYQSPTMKSEKEEYKVNKSKRTDIMICFLDKNGIIKWAKLLPRIFKTVVNDTHYPLPIVSANQLHLFYMATENGNDNMYYAKIDQSGQIVNNFETMFNGDYKYKVISDVFKEKNCQKISDEFILLWKDRGFKYNNTTICKIKMY